MAGWTSCPAKTGTSKRSPLKKVRGPRWIKHHFRDLGYTDGYIKDLSDVAIDVNGDGYPDIVSCSYWEEPLTWWENPSAHDKPWRKTIIQTGAPVEFVFLVDLLNTGQAKQLLPQLCEGGAKVEGPRRNMERREALKLVALTALSPKVNVLQAAVASHMDAAPAKPHLAQYKLQFFSEDESRLLDRLMEMIIPADSHSSATAIHQDMEYLGNTYLAAFPECTHREHQG